MHFFQLAKTLFLCTARIPVIWVIISLQLGLFDKIDRLPDETPVLTAKRGEIISLIGGQSITGMSPVGDRVGDPVEA